MDNNESENLRALLESASLTDDQAQAVGQAIIDFLHIKIGSQPTSQIKTSYGTKTRAGLGRSILRVIQENLKNPSSK